MIFAFDIFIHNADRWPLIWDNSGNFLIKSLLS